MQSPQSPTTPLRWTRLAAAIAGASALIVLLMQVFAPMRVARGETDATNTLQIDKSGPNTAFAGSLITYTIEVTNDTDSFLANGVVITDFWNTQIYSGDYAWGGDIIVASSTFTTQTLPVYAQFNLLPMNPGERGVITLHMVISPGGQPSYNPSNYVPIFKIEGNSVVVTAPNTSVPVNTDRVDTTIVGPVLRLTKTITPSGSAPKVRAGRLVTFTFRLDNLPDVNTTPATGIVITEKLPNGVMFYTASPPGLVTFFPATSTVYWNLVDPLPVSGTTWVTLTARVTPTVVGNSTINNGTTNCGAWSSELVRFALCDKNASFNTDDAFEKFTFTESPPPQSGTISKTFPDRVVTYTVYVYNPFPDPVSDMVVTDTLPTYNNIPTQTFQYSGLLSSGGGPPVEVSQTSRIIAWQLPEIQGWGVYTFAFRAYVPPQMRIDDNQPEKIYQNKLEGGANGVVIATNDGSHDDPMKVKVVPQITVIKTVTPSQQTFSYPATYTLSISNTGPTTIRDIYLTDTLPTNADCAFRWDEMLSGTPPYSTTTNRAAWGPFTVGPYSQLTVGTFQVVVFGRLNATCRNTIEGYSPDTYIVKRTDLAPVTVEVPFRYDKTVDRSSVILGGAINYTVKEWNVGSVDATMDYFADFLPLGFFFGDSPIFTDDLDSTGGTYVLPANDLLGQSAYQTTFPVVVSETYECDNLPKSYPQAAGTFGMEIIAPLDPDLTGFWVNPAPAASVMVHPQARVYKSANPPNGLPGDVITYTITLSNNTSSTINNITVSDTLPAGFTYVDIVPGTPLPVSTIPPYVIWQGQSIPANGTAALSFRATAAITVSDNYPNNVKAFSVPGSARLCIPRLNPALTVKVRRGIVEVNKTASPTSVGPFGTFLYNISLSNKGPYTVTVGRFTETLPGADSGQPWTFVSMQSGDPAPDISNPHAPVWTNLTIGLDKTINLRFNVRTQTQVGTYPNYIFTSPNAGYMTATLPASWVLTRPTSYNGAPVTVVPGAGLNKEVDKPSAIAGEDVVYTITLVNISGNAISNVRITDTLPTGFTFKQMVGGDVVAPASTNPLVFTLSSVPNGATRRMIFRVTIPLTQASGTYYNNVAARADQLSIAPTGPTAPVIVSGRPTLNLSKQVDPTAVIAGRDVTYTLTLINPDLDEAVDAARITDTLPSNVSFVSMISADPNPAVVGQQLVWAGITVPPNSTKTMIFRAHVASGASDGTYYNQLNGSTGTFVFDPTGPTAPVVVAQPIYDVQVSKSDGSVTGTIGGTVVYTIRYTNTSNVLGLTAREVVLTDTFSPDAYLVADAPDWNFVGPGVYTRLIGDLPAGAGGFVTIALAIDPGIPEEYLGITNTARIGALPPLDVPEAFEQNTANNTATDIDTIRGPDIAVVGLNVSPSNPREGQLFNVVVTFKNQGLDPTQGAPIPGFSDPGGWFGADLYVKPANAPPPTGPTDRYLGICPDTNNPCGSPRFDLYRIIKAAPGVGLAPGETVVVTYTYAVLAGGVKWLYVQADPFWGDGQPYSGSAAHGRILEADEQNNVYGPVSITVQSNKTYLPVVLKNR